MGDYVIRGMAAEGQVVAFACDTTELVEIAKRRHGLSHVATAALGRTMSAVAMMSLQLENEAEELTIQIKGNGPLGGVVAVGNGRGEVRGYVDNPEVELPLNSKGKIDVAGGIGIGVMQIIKDLGLKEPYMGSTHLITSEIAEDLAYYFTASEQVPSAVGLGVLINNEDQVWTSGGFILQLLPGASDEIADTLQKRVEAFPPLTTFLAEGHSPEEVLETLLEGLDYHTMEKTPVIFKCTCNKGRVSDALLSIGAKDLASLVEEGKEVEMTCHYCNEHYVFTIPEVKVLLEIALQKDQN